MRETKRLTNVKKSVKMSGHDSSIINWSWNNIIYNILWAITISDQLSTPKNREICEMRAFHFFELWEYIESVLIESVRVI